MRRGCQKMTWLDGIHQCNGHELGANFRRWRGTGRPGVLQSMGSQKSLGHDWETEQQLETHKI